MVAVKTSELHQVRNVIGSCMIEKRDGGSSRFATFFVSLGEQYFRSSEALCGLSS